MLEALSVLDGDTFELLFERHLRPDNSGEIWDV